MCESTAYMLKDGVEEKLLDDVVLVTPEDGRIVLTSLLGDRLEVDGEFHHFDLMKHRLVLRPKP